MTNEEKEHAIREGFIKNKTRGTYELAMYLISKYDMVTIGSKYRETYVYQDGIYSYAENLVIYPEIQRILGDLINKSAKSETFHKIQDATSQPNDIFQITAPQYIPLVNGVYDIATKTLLPHDSKYRFKFKLPVTYNPEATCPRTEAFLDQVLTPDQRLTVEEWMGYYLYRNYMFKKAIIFVGEGDTGKTTLLQVINNLIGLDNISAVSLQKIGSDKFAAAHLYEKHANIVDELEKEDITKTGNFKIATGGGTITGEYKFGNQFSFNNYAKFTFACNQIPDVTNFDDEAYFNRWMVIRFEKKIEKKIPNFVATLTTDEERSGLFNLALKGLERLLINESFTYASTAIDTKLEMLRSGSSIANYVVGAVQKDVGAEISKEDLYESYVDYCAQNNFAPETMIMFGKKISFYSPYMTEGLISTMKEGKFVQVRGWRNVSIKLTDEQLENQKENQKYMDDLTSTIIKKNEAIIIKES